MPDTSIPVEIQIVAVGNKEAVDRLNEVSNSARRLGSDGFGSLEHFIVRLSGGNRELMLGLRGLSQLMSATNLSADKFAAAFNATIAGVGLGVAAVALVKFFESVRDEGKRSFEEAGLSSHGFFEDMAAGLGVIDPLNEKLEATADILARLNHGFEDVKRNVTRNVEDARGTTEATTPRRAIEDAERLRTRNLDLLKSRGDEIRNELKSLAGMSNTELVDEWNKTFHDRMSFTRAAFGTRNGIQTDIEGELTRQAAENDQRMRDIDRNARGKVAGAGKDEVDATLDEFWRGLREKSTSARLGGKSDMLSDFLLNNGNGTVGYLLDQLGAQNPYGRTPEAAGKLLEPLFRGVEANADRLREDAMHPRLAPLAVAGSAEAYRLNAAYKTNQEGAQSVEERQLAQQQIQTALLQTLTTTLRDLVVHGGN